MKIGVYCHRLDRTGAPIMLNRLARHLAKAHTVDLLLPALPPGPLLAEYEKAGIAARNGAVPQEYDAFILNTLISGELVVRMAGMVPTLYWVHEPRGGLPFLTSGRSDPRAFALADRVVFPTRWQADTLFKPYLTRDNWEVVPYGIGTDPTPRPCPFEKKPGKLYLVQLGMLTLRKGHDVTMRALAELDNPDIEVFLCGGSDVEPEFAARVRAFVEERILPLEADPASYDEHENIAPALLERLRGEVKAAGLWAPQMPSVRGGQGLGIVGMAAAYEEMNRSIFGPVCFNCAAPDDGNMQLLNKVATEAQKERWLQPIVDGKVRSAFVMTEPHPGGGSDPSMMRTRAERKGDRWVISGHKWFITGAGEAQHFILIARTSDDKRKGLTAFLFDKDQPGWEIVRRIPIMGPEEHGGHCELRFDGLEVSDENVLMNIGDGLKATQIRLGPARLTHCMRWTGLSKRAMEIAAAYVRERESFGTTLAGHEGVQWMMGDVAMQIEIGRLLIMKAAWQLDRGDFARKEVSMAKVHVADTLHKAVDTAIQLCGARGYSKDTALEWMYRYARQARLVDGASEVHKMVLARFYMDEGDGFWAWG